LYEAQGTRTRVSLATSLPIRAAFRTDMLEAKLEALQIDDNALNLEIRPFEIKTLCIQV
jgi:alpha-mannosidase